MAASPSSPQGSADGMATSAFYMKWRRNVMAIDTVYLKESREGMATYPLDLKGKGSGMGKFLRGNAGWSATSALDPHLKGVGWQPIYSMYDRILKGWPPMNSILREKGMGLGGRLYIFSKGSWRSNGHHPFLYEREKVRRPPLHPI